jgi:ABC-type branched-subunit amino acid transport system ATPase component
MAEALLVARAVGKRFGGLAALDHVSLAIAAGEVRGLIGPNGAGKTTLVNVLSGVLAASAGSIRFAGQEIAGEPAHAVARRGIRRTFQTLRLFPEMSVLENVAVGYHAHTRAEAMEALFATRRSAREQRETMARAHDALAFVGLAVSSELPAGALAYGQQRMLELARALVGAPKLLLLDEPAAGMNPAECDHLLELIRRIRAQSIAVLVIEHRMDLIMEACGRITVLNYGRNLAEGTPAEIQAHEGVIEAYLGRATHA